MLVFSTQTYKALSGYYLFGNFGNKKICSGKLYDTHINTSKWEIQNVMLMFRHQHQCPIIWY